MFILYNAFIGCKIYFIFFKEKTYKLLKSYVGSMLDFFF